MNLEEFNYHLPPELIARYPAKKRTDSRLLCLDPITGKTTHQKFTDITQWLKPKDLLVLNNTKVIPARIHGKKQTGGKIEILLERILNEKEALIHIKANNAPQQGTQIIIADHHPATILTRQDRLFHIKTNTPILEILEQSGEIPLPPYLNRKAETEDSERYQTIFAKHKGAVAAPTAGLHFDEKTLTSIQNQGTNIGYLTLHVGAGTFLPVDTQDITQHQLHTEQLEVPATLCQQIKKTKQNNGRIIAVGTTVVRALETAAQTGEIKAFKGETNIFIYPGYKYKIVDMLLTNFHLPKSSLLMLISALAGKQNILNVYQTAIKEKYRFYSYGDAMLITGRKDND